MEDFVRNTLLRKIPTEQTIFEWFEKFIDTIQTDLFDDYIKLDENEFRRFYKSSYEKLLKDYGDHKKIKGLKRDLSFNDLCEYYNNSIYEYKIIIKDTDLDEPHSLNRRTGAYYWQLERMKEIFEFINEKQKG